MHGGDVTLIGYDHVQLAMPVGGEDAARDFFSGTLGLHEVAKPAALAGRGGCWFEGDGLALHLGVDPAFRAATKAHPAFTVRGLAALRDRLTSAGIAIRDDVPINGCVRFFCDDPFDNRLEFVEREESP